MLKPEEFYRRGPLDQRTYPTAQPQGIADQDQCAALPLLRAQYFEMISGGVTQQLRDGDRWQSFHPGNAAALKREIVRLEQLCSYAGQARAIRAGPPRRICGPCGYAASYRRY